MELITKRSIVDNHIEHMREYAHFYIKELDRVNALSDPTLEELVGALDTPSITRFTCDECNQEVDAAVELGDDEIDNTWICQECLQKALALFPKL